MKNFLNGLEVVVVAPAAHEDSHPFASLPFGRDQGRSLWSASEAARTSTMRHAGSVSPRTAGARVAGGGLPRDGGEPGGGPKGAGATWAAPASRADSRPARAR